MSHLHKHSDPLQQNDIQLRCLQFLLIIAEMFLHLDWSPPVVNYIDWTLFGKAHVSI